MTMPSRDTYKASKSIQLLKLRRYRAASAMVYSCMHARESQTGSMGHASFHEVKICISLAMLQREA